MSIQKKSLISTLKSAKKASVAREDFSGVAATMSPVAKHAVAKHAVAKHAVAKQAVAKQAVAKQAVAKQAVSKHTAVKN